MLELTAVVTSPSGRTERCMITELDPTNYCIRFVPQEMGVHTVSVRHRNTHIPGRSCPRMLPNLSSALALPPARLLTGWMGSFTAWIGLPSFRY